MTTHAGSLGLGASLDQAAVTDLNEPVFTKERLTSGRGNFLVITRDYGSGLEIREVYVYRQKEAGAWELLSYLKTNLPHVQAGLEGDTLMLKTESGRMLLALDVGASN